eukprot:5244845-Prymnesium_polylepis.2
MVRERQRLAIRLLRLGGAQQQLERGAAKVERLAVVLDRAHDGRDPKQRRKVGGAVHLTFERLSALHVCARRAAAATRVCGARAQMVRAHGELPASHSGGAAATAGAPGAAPVPRKSLARCGGAQRRAEWILPRL